MCNKTENKTELVFKLKTLYKQKLAELFTEVENALNAKDENLSIELNSSNGSYCVVRNSDSIIASQDAVGLNLCILNETDEIVNILKLKLEKIQEHIYLIQDLNKWSNLR